MDGYGDFSANPTEVNNWIYYWQQTVIIIYKAQHRSQNSNNEIWFLVYNKVHNLSKCDRIKYSLHNVAYELLFGKDGMSIHVKISNTSSVVKCILKFWLLLISLSIEIFMLKSMTIRHWLLPIILRCCVYCKFQINIEYRKCDERK